MTTCARLFLLFSIVLLLSASVLAQAGQNAAGPDQLTTEVAGLRKSLQTLNTRLEAISEELLAPPRKNEENSVETVRKVATSLDLLTHAEERAEVLRKQLLDLVDKETTYRMRMAQFDEDLRPENVANSMAGVGSGTRAPEMRDTRLRVLQNEKRGVENLLNLTIQGRMRLEEDVRQADVLVTKLRQRLFPLIDMEIDKISPPQ